MCPIQMGGLRLLSSLPLLPRERLRNNPNTAAAAVAATPKKPRRRSLVL